jgi:hypothetical protein
LAKVSLLEEALLSRGDWDTDSLGGLPVMVSSSSPTSAHASRLKVPDLPEPELDDPMEAGAAFRLPGWSGIDADAASNFFDADDEALENIVCRHVVLVRNSCAAMEENVSVTQSVFGRSA